MPPSRILFVCMGNICRSPAAEGVMRHHLKNAGLDREITVDSAGTINFHAGHPPDGRMTQAAAHRGINLQHRARQIRSSDLETFDLILVMDHDNLANVHRLDPKDLHRDKIRLFCDYCTRTNEGIVPDPYYGTPDDFEIVLDLLEDGCGELTRRLQAKTALP